MLHESRDIVKFSLVALDYLQVAPFNMFQCHLSKLLKYVQPQVSRQFLHIPNNNYDKKIYKSSVSNFPNQSARSISKTLSHGVKVEVNNININYEISNQTGTVVALCLPGSMGSVETDFAPQMKELGRNNLQIIAWDPPGYGKSRPPSRKFSTSFFEEDASLAMKMMKQLGFERFSLLGWSDGGITALIMAAQYPQNIEKLVVWGANSYVHDEDIRTYEAIRDINKWSERNRAPMEQMYGKEYFKSTWGQWIDAMVQIYEERGGDICDHKLPLISCPTLIIHGLKDALVDLNHAKNLHKKIPNSRLVEWENGKHNLHLKYANEFNQLVNDFLLE